MIHFVFTPDEARDAAEAVVTYLRAQGWSVQVERALEADAPYRTTILGRLNKTMLLVEAQGSASYHAGLQELTGWLAKKRIDCEFYLAVPDSAVVPASTLREIRADGIGLLIVDENAKVTSLLSARNPILMINLDASLTLGDCRAEIVKAYNDFNHGNRKAALRDVCEIVEREVGALARKAARRAYLTKTEAQVEAMDFSTRIDILASHALSATGKPVLVTPTLKGDLQSFRSARNLVDHPAKSKSDLIRRERQMPERMLMGPRLISEILGLKRRVR